MTIRMTRISFRVKNTGTASHTFWIWAYLINLDYPSEKKMQKITFLPTLNPGATTDELSYQENVDLRPGKNYIAVIAVYPNESSARANTNKLHDWNSGDANDWDPSRGAYVTITAAANAQITAIQVY